MTRNVLTVVAAAALSVFAQGTFAQASSPSRADVKAETKAAQKAGELSPAGEGRYQEDGEGREVVQVEQDSRATQGRNPDRREGG